MFDLHGAPSKELSSELSGYDAGGVKLALFEDQRKKCAWCERRRDFSSSPIEHYRPKDGAWRHLPGELPRVSSEHYWWLTWTWTNLLFACARCNDRGHKANYFPLEPGTAEVATPQRPTSVVDPSAFDLTSERPALLDPSVDCFLDHVRWTPTNTSLARRLWSWTPHHLSERGKATIKVLKLDELADEVEAHLIRVLDVVEEVEQHLRGRRTLQAAASWERVLAWLEPTESFTAATWCALTHWMPPARIQALELRPIPRPR